MGKISIKRVPRKLTESWIDRQGRQTEEQTLFQRTFLTMSRGPRETTKEVLIDDFSTLQDLFVGHRHDTREAGYCRC